MAYVNDYKEVIYGDYCKKCKYKDLTEQEDPCFDCIEEDVNLWTHRPTKFEEAEKTNE